jgi:hypothetical protein
MGEEDADSTIGESRRRELLNRIGRRTATIGQRIPETIDVDGDPFELRAFVMETKSQGAIPPAKRESVRTVRSTLKRERERRTRRLESAPLSEEEATRLADTILGLERAITALGNLSEPDLDGRSAAADLQGTRRWVEFVDQLSD